MQTKFDLGQTVYGFNFDEIESLSELEILSGRVMSFIASSEGITYSVTNIGEMDEEHLFASIEEAKNALMESANNIKIR